jgi:hypothetical protein
VVCSGAKKLARASNPTEVYILKSSINKTPLNKKPGYKAWLTGEVLYEDKLALAT